MKAVALPPWVASPKGDWVTTNELAERLGKSRSTIERWCRDGTLVDSKFQLYRDLKRRWWIRLPLDMK